MPKRLILILGGARSGKSALALLLAREIGGPTVFLATAEPGDDEMRRRIEAHRASRPREWRTIEEPIDLAGALEGQAGDASGIVVDCVTLWVSNVLARASAGGLDEPDAAAAEARLLQEIGGLHDWYRGSAASLILVSNEVGLGLVPPYPSGRAFRDLLGTVNQRLAQIATEVYLMVAGIPVDLKRLAIRPWRQEEDSSALP